MDQGPKVKLAYRQQRIQVPSYCCGRVKMHRLNFLKSLSDWVALIGRNGRRDAQSDSHGQKIPFGWTLLVLILFSVAGWIFIYQVFF